MKILFYTFNEGHLVSDKEYDRMKVAFSKEGIDLIRWHKDKGEYQGEYDIIMVKGFSHTWSDIPHGKHWSQDEDGKRVPVVYLSIGTEFKKGIDLKEANEPLRELYFNADAVVHISKFCQDITHEVFGHRLSSNDEYVIIPGCAPNLPQKYIDLPDTSAQLKLATTCIPRPVKRVEETERLCQKYGIQLVPAYGSVTDFSYYHDVHGYIHLSRKEGMPNTVLEALSYGLPCIVTNYGGAKEAVGDAGVVIKNDPEGMFDLSNIEPIDDFLFEEAIQRFVETLPELRNCARRRVLSELNDSTMSNQFKRVFDKILCQE